MAEVTSLGVQTPVALPYLIGEGLLPENPRRDLYQWETYVSNDGHSDLEEELLATRTCVIWSQGKVIRNVYRFDLEGEDVIQAVVTRFSSSSPTTGTQDDGSTRDGAAINPGYGNSSKKRIASSTQPASTGLDRAVVVFLKTKAHVYFLHGSNHIIDLPFEISKVFAAPRGLLLQRKTASPPSLPPTPQVPAPPPNSFFSSQIQPSSSYLQSPTLAKSFGGSQPFKPSPLGGNTGLDALFQHVFGSADSGAEAELATLYSLTTPISDFGVVTYSLQHHRPRISSKASSGLSVEFEALDAAERILYVSSFDELGSHDQTHGGSLTLLVTVNDETRTLTLWHAWYIDEQSLSSLLKQRAAQKAAKTKRRSSFMSANVATGATTPAVRAREGARESFAAAGSMRLPGDGGPSNAAASSRKPTRQEEEAEMAHQMDPDFQPSTSQQTVRESRRISSLNADVRTGQHSTTSFAGAGGRRNTSFGGPGERRSLGNRKSRGSTPGSVLSRSLGPEDDLMELDSSFDVENEESIDAVVRHIRATHEAAAADGIFGGTDENFKRELVVQKIHSMAVSFAVSTERDSASFQVLTLRDPLPGRNAESRCLGVYIRDGASGDLTCLQLNVKQRLLWPKSQTTTNVAIPILANEIKLGKCGDIVKLKDSKVEALLSSAGLSLSPIVPTFCPVQTAASYRARSRLSLSSVATQQDGEVGKNRTLQGPATGSSNMVHSGSHGQYDEIGEDALHHRRQLKLTPSNPTVDHLLQVCQLILPSLQAQMISGIWMLAHANLLRQNKLLAATMVNVELAAFATTVFVLTGHFIDYKARAALKVSRLASGKTITPQLSSQINHQQRLSQLSSCGPWQKAGQARHDGSPSSPLSPKRQPRVDRRDRCLPLAAELADEMLQTIPWLAASGSLSLSATGAGTLMLALHLFSQERKLCLLTSSANEVAFLAAITAQLGGLLGLKAWSFEEGEYLSLEGVGEGRWAFVKSTSTAAPQLSLMDEPVSVFMWFEHAMKYHSTERFPSLSDVASTSLAIPVNKDLAAAAAKLTPRILSLSDMLTATVQLHGFFSQHS